MSTARAKVPRSGLTDRVQRACGSASVDRMDFRQHQEGAGGEFLAEQSGGAVLVDDGLGTMNIADLVPMRGCGRPRRA